MTRWSWLVSLLLWTASVPVTLTLAAAADEEECTVGEDGVCEPLCNDKHRECKPWAAAGECAENPRFMLFECQAACDMCGKTTTQIQEEVVQALEAKEKEQQRLEELRSNFGLVQNVKSDLAEKKLEEMLDYMRNIVMVEERFLEIRDFCQNKYDDCVEWASVGECTANSAFMTTNCAPACQTCHLLIYEERCPWKKSNETNLWKNPGDLEKMFQRIVADKRYKVDVLSQPPNGPWVVVLEDFISDEECNRLIELGTKRGYEKSKDVGEKQPDGTYSDFDSPDRTSTNSWCLDECYTDEHTKAVLSRIEDITGVPDAYQEYLQLLKYTEGQFYGQHHDYIKHLADREEGVRIVTVFLYLNDVEAGGGTNFPLLGNLTVMPKKGRALIWPSVLDEDPNAKDARTDHQALPVEKGIKYGANSWLHNRDFKAPFNRGCA